MKDLNQIYLQRVNELLEFCDSLLSKKFEKTNTFTLQYGLPNDDFFQVISLSLSFITDVYNENHHYYTFILDVSHHKKPESIESIKGIFKAIKIEIEKGYLSHIKDIVIANIFSDYLEMAHYLLSEQYKDAAAVIIGSTLEQHLRGLCVKNIIPIEETKNGKTTFLMANSLNTELYKANVINKLDNKNLISWFEIRNNAAHGHFTNYTKEQVEIMYIGVSDFITRTQL